MTLTQDQQDALDIFMDFITNDTDSEMILEGPPGTGKSFLTKEMIRHARAHSDLVKLLSSIDGNLNIVVTATSNESAKIAEENSGEPARTIHSYLGISPYNDFATGESRLRKKKDYAVQKDTLIFIDEAFSIDSVLLNMIRESTKDCKVIYIGDRAQTTPIKEKESPLCRIKVPTAELNEPVRFKPGPIFDLSMDIRAHILQGAPFPTIESKGGIIHVMDGDAFGEKVEEEFTNNLGAKNKILTWTNDRSNLYNNHVRELLGVTGPYQVGEYLVANSPIFCNRELTYSTGSMVKVTSSSYAKMHDIEGQWLTLDNVHSVFSAYNFGEVTAKLKRHKKNAEWADKFFTQEFFADLRPPHSSTVHKAQGHTLKNSFIDYEEIRECRNKSTVARLTYVALTRATTEVFIY